jgi:hypothetical protein
MAGEAKGKMGHINYYQLYNTLQMNKPYTKGCPPPLKYKFRDYRDLITNQPENISGIHEKPFDYSLRPIEINGIAARDEESWADLYSRIYSFQDWETKQVLSAGQPMPKPNNLGPEMTDAEFKNWCGLPEGLEEKIQQAAFKVGDKIYPSGPIHDSGVVPEEEYGKEWISGFVTNLGRFLDRRQASEFLYGQTAGKYHSLDSLEVPKFYKNQPAASI